MRLLIVIVLFLGLANAANCGPFTSLVNLEKLYTLEDELITIADVIVKQEKQLHDGEDTHDLNKIESIVENAKNIHRKVGGENTTEYNITQYITHPINAFHLTKRLVREWSTIVDTLRYSKTCIIPMRHKVDNIGDNIPSEEQLSVVGKSIINLQNIYDISANEIVSGKIFANNSLEPLSLDDQYTLARAAYEDDDFNLAVDWLIKVTSDYTDENDVKFSLVNALNLLSSSYMKMKRPNDAIATIDKILEMDPNNRMATSNKKYLSQKSDSKQEDEGTSENDREKRKHQLAQQLCSGKTATNVTRQSRLKCIYLRTRNQSMFSRPTIRAEILNYSPLIMLIHNFTNSSLHNATLHIGYEMMRDNLYKTYYYRPDGIDSMAILDKTDEKLTEKLEEKIRNVHVTHVKPIYTTFLVKNIGMEGYTNTKTELDKDYMGSFLIFLSDVKHGGEIVFPFSKTMVTPKKGSMIFYERKAHKQIRVCPVVMDTEWVAEYPLYDGYFNMGYCYRNKVIRPKIS